MTVMTYGQFLLAFLLVPVMGLALLVLRDWRKAYRDKGKPWQWASSGLLMALVFLAVIYTAPWDNHLIASGVWSYSPSLVNGVTLGVIPLEEVLFFPLETILVGLWVLWMMPRVSVDAHVSSTRDIAPLIRWIAVTLGVAAWLAGLLVLMRGWRLETYVGWELVWALPPILLQWGLGGDILWRRRRLLLATLLPPVLYLSAADAFAIHQGIWTISPRWSLGLLLGGVLPLEELLFFLLTSVLITGGLILGSAPEMRSRLHIGTQSRPDAHEYLRSADAQRP